MASYKIDYEKNRIDIVFDRKPSVEIRDSLKCKGWRWNSFDKCWYHYYSESHLQFAKDICDKKIEEIVLICIIVLMPIISWNKPPLRYWYTQSATI